MPIDTLQETGHITMLDRVKAAHRMVTAMVDSWDERTPERPPKWAKSQDDRMLYKSLLDKFDMQELDKIIISKKQFYYLRDLYERSL